MLHIEIVVSAVAAGLLGCGSSEPPRSDGKEPPTRATLSDDRRPGEPSGSASSRQATDQETSCDARVEELERWLTALPPPSPRFVIGHLTLPRTKPMPHGKVALRGPVLEVDPMAVVLAGKALWRDGDAIRDLAKRVADHVAVERKARDATRGERLDAVALAIDADVSWEVVVALVDGVARSGVGRLDLVFAVDRPLEKWAPPKRASDAKIKPPPGGRTSRANHMSKVAQELFAPCPPLIRLTTKMAASPDRKSRVLIEGAAGAVRECQCATGPEDLRTWIWYLLIDPDVPAEFLAPILISSEGLGTPILASRGARWADMAGRVLDTAKPGSNTRVTFRVKP